MHYISTRGNEKSAPLNFEQATLAGLAPDSGLYIPATWPTFSHAEMLELRGLNYDQLAFRIISRFTGDCIPTETLEQITVDAYRSFAHPAIAPLQQLDDELYLLELFHGPTWAFKDFALQFLGRVFGYFLERSGQSCTIVGATSGDTGSAAIEAVRGQSAITMYMLHPENRVSEVQRRQMTTVLDDNIHNLAIDGTFDDCQNLVKAMFNDEQFRKKHRLAAVNSINWARIAAQTVYYFYAALALGSPDRAVNFSVPSGNFGNVFAGYAAREMGLPINQLIIGSNRNDILTRFFATGHMQRRDLKATISPSMDIQIASNFERYLFELVGRDSKQIIKLMQEFSEHGEFNIGEQLLQKATELFSAKRFSDAETRAHIEQLYQQTGQLIDPHSAIGVGAAVETRAANELKQAGTPTIVLATAHPAKFADAVTAACDTPVQLPPSLQKIMTQKEKMHSMPNDLSGIQALINQAA